MRIRKTEDTNCILKGDGESVLDVPATIISFEDGSRAFEMCLELSIEEMELLSQTGRLYLTVFGDPPSPVALNVRSYTDIEHADDFEVDPLD